MFWVVSQPNVDGFGSNLDFLKAGRALRFLQTVPGIPGPQERPRGPAKVLEPGILLFRPSFPFSLHQKQSAYTRLEPGILYFKPILFLQFSICLIFMLGGQILLSKRAMSFLDIFLKGCGIPCAARNLWDRGVWVPGAFKLYLFHPFKLNLFCKFQICTTFILGGHFLLPQRAKSEKGEFSAIPEIDETEGF